MGNTAQTGQVLSLPQGGGALQGIGEKFSPDLFTGTGNFNVPIALPPGRNGFQPELALVYSTGNGNGPFGLGWNLSIPGVSRKTADGVPQYNEDERDLKPGVRQDVFILSGAEDLVAVAENYPKPVQYRPRTEGLFARITHHRGQTPGKNHWKVESKDGLVSTYGYASAATPAPAVLAQPDDPTHIFAWKLTETADPFGNRICYEYTEDKGPRGNQLLLKHIRYVDYGERTANTFLVHVDFDYEERSDPFSDYRAGFEIRTAKRCRAIQVSTHTADGKVHPVRTYRFAYETAAHNGVSLLQRLDIIVYDDEEKPYDADDPVSEYRKQLPPLTFGYTQFAPEQRRFEVVGGRDLPTRALSAPDLELVDLHGSSLPDILEMNGTVRYWRNLGNGTFDMPRPMQEAPPHGLADPGVQMIDANGDGRMDLLVTSGSLAGYYPLTNGAKWDRKSFQRYSAPPSIDLEDPEVKLVDLDGDGYTDILRSGSRLECFYNDPDPRLAWQRTRFAQRQTLDLFPNVNFSDQRVRLADMTGDGLQDIVLIHDGAIEYWPNLGHNRWGKRIRMHASPRLRDHGYTLGFDPQRLLLGDVDGDGLADLIYVDYDRVLLWINQSGNGWTAEPIVIIGTPPVTNMDSVRLVDLHGTGVSGVLWSSDATALSRHRLMFLDLTGGQKPYVLNEMDNHMGAVTRVAYKPSTYYFLQDQQKPATRWRTPLPFPVQVVARVEVIDQISRGKLTTEYRYHHGYWDGAEREFRGFGMVEQLDTERFTDYHAAGLHGDVNGFNSVDRHFAPPLLTKTWFHQGPVGEEFGDWAETDYTHEYWPGDPQLLGHTEQVNDFLHNLASNNGGASALAMHYRRRIKRDALRTLRGSILRSELYALDGSDRQDRPYTVTEHSYDLAEIHAPTDQPARKRIFFPHGVAQRTTQWERGDDPMTQVSFTDYQIVKDQLDPYGRPHRQTTIACPRGWRKLSDQPTEHYLATRTVTDYAAPVDSKHYLHNRVARVTTYEMQNNAGHTLLELRDRPDPDDKSVLIGQTLTFYDDTESQPDNGAFIGLGYGQIGRYGVPVRTLTLVLTDNLLKEVYGDALPPYLQQSAAWTGDYPRAFQTQLPPHTGYLYKPDAACADGWFVVGASSRYDFHDRANPQPRGLSLIQRAPVDQETRIVYDQHDLLPVKFTAVVRASAAAGAEPMLALETTAHYNYRLLQPEQIVDANRNETRFLYAPTGLLRAQWVRNQPAADRGEQPPAGDQARPSVRFVYDFYAFERTGQPISVQTVRQLYHDSQSDVPLPLRDETITTVEYSDGFGRLVQTRTQGEEVRFGDERLGGGETLLSAAQTDGDRAEISGRVNTDLDAPNVVVSGAKTYDNKGQVIEQYEPYFDTGWAYQPAAQVGEKITMVYDPRGQVIRTINPDGSEQRVIYGTPTQLATPDAFTPTPWERYAYDANDNAGRTHPTTAGVYRHHYDTPTSTRLDALGRAVLAVQRNRNNSCDTVQELRTVSHYDIRGNLTLVQDALGRDAFVYHYDLANRSLRVISIDAGDRLSVYDAAGNVVETRDLRGALVLRGYDRLNRPTALWARNRANDALTLREQLVYGDDQPVERNQRGRLIRHDDESGQISLDYDFKGNVIKKARRVFDSEAILAAFDPAVGPAKVFCVDWANSPLLDEMPYDTLSSYDALNRVRRLTYPRSADGQFYKAAPIYNRAGALARVELYQGKPEGEVDASMMAESALEKSVYVEQIAYNAKGQRVLIAYGNGVLTRYAYDPQSFRLRRLRTEHFSHPAGDPLHFAPQAPLLQDLTYDYDLAGNIWAIEERTPGCGILNTAAGPDALDRTFTYDALYRLLSATGREGTEAPPAAPWIDTPRTQDPTRTRGYTQQYTYDAAGNLTQLRHSAQHNDGFTRAYTLAPGNNRLASFTPRQEAAPFAYTYDRNGNMTSEAASRHFVWDQADRLRAFYIHDGNHTVSQQAHYLYDATGMRVMKVVKGQGSRVQLTIYIDGIFEHHRWREASGWIQGNYLHVMDDQSRIATVYTGNSHIRGKNEPVQYHLGDHLGSSNVVVGGKRSDDSSFINREEYYPYGESSFGSFGKKRYRYSGKERDEESGLYYYGARYYAPWLGRWVSCDPEWTIDGLNLFVYGLSNPTRFSDPSGRQVENPSDSSLKTPQAVTDGRARASFAKEFVKNNQQLKYGQERVWNPEKRRMEIVTNDEKIDCSEFGTIVASSQGYDPDSTNAAGQAEHYKKHGEWITTIREVKVGDFIFWKKPTGTNVDHMGVVVEVDDKGSVKVAHATVNGYKAGSLKIDSLTPKGGLWGGSKELVGIGRPKETSLELDVVEAEKAANEFLAERIGLHLRRLLEQAQSVQGSPDHSNTQQSQISSDKVAPVTPMPVETHSDSPRLD